MHVLIFCSNRFLLSLDSDCRLSFSAPLFYVNLAFILFPDQAGDSLVCWREICVLFPQRRIPFPFLWSCISEKKSQSTHTTARGYRGISEGVLAGKCMHRQLRQLNREGGKDQKRRQCSTVPTRRAVGKLYGSLYAKHWSRLFVRQGHACS